MLYDQSFAPGSHDLFHPFPNVLSRSSLELGDTFDTTLHLSDAMFKIAFPESERFVDQRLAIEVKEIKNFDYLEK